MPREASAASIWRRDARWLHARYRQALVAVQPRQAMPWNLRRVVHLHRRAGFAATWMRWQARKDQRPACSD